MTFKVKFIFGILLTIATSCNVDKQKQVAYNNESTSIESNKSTKEKKAISGIYDVIVDYKYGGEKFILDEDGAAAWEYERDSKLGNWELSNGKLIISIIGNSGTIEETYVLKKGTYVDDLTNSRRLKKQTLPKKIK